ncbi:MAG: HAD family hydrolase [Epulopiscium sp.]|nr:HAD family hydrolase [Candidatus Epulonipiscium sp.]
MYKNYLFDLYGTLINIKTDEEKSSFWKGLAQFYSFNGAPYEGLELKLIYLQKIREKKEGNLKTKYPEVKLVEVITEMYWEKGIKPSLELIIHTTQFFRITSTEYIKLYDGVIKFLDILKGRGKKLYVLSNAQREFTLPELDYLGIAKYFDGIYISSDYEICKPDIQFINELIKREKLSVKESIMIGNDHIADVGVATGVGMDCLYIHSNLSQELESTPKCKYTIMDGDLKDIWHQI